MRLAALVLVGSLCLIGACGSEDGKPSAQKPVELTTEQLSELSELEAQVRTLEQERAKLFDGLPSAEQISQTRVELEDRKNRIGALTQRDKVVPCLVAELARIVSEGTSIDIVEIAAEGVVIELPLTDGSKFEPAFNACGAVGASKKIDGGWAFEIKLLPVEPTPREKTKPVEAVKPPPPVSVLGQLPKEPARRLQSLRPVVDAIGKEIEVLRKQHEDMAGLVEEEHKLGEAERAVKSPPDVPGTLDAVKNFAKQAGVEVSSLRPESGNTLVRVHVEMRGKLLDIDALFVKLQTRPNLLVVETLVLKPGNGETAVPVRMTLASPRL